MEPADDPAAGGHHLVRALAAVPDQRPAHSRPHQRHGPCLAARLPEPAPVRPGAGLRCPAPLRSGGDRGHRRHQHAAGGTLALAAPGAGRADQPHCRRPPRSAGHRHPVRRGLVPPARRPAAAHRAAECRPPGNPHHPGGGQGRRHQQLPAALPAGPDRGGQHAGTHHLPFRPRRSGARPVHGGRPPASAVLGPGGPHGPEQPQRDAEHAARSALGRARAHAARRPEGAATDPLGRRPAAGRCLTRAAEGTQGSAGQHRHRLGRLLREPSGRCPAPAHLGAGAARRRRRSADHPSLQATAVASPAGQHRSAGGAAHHAAALPHQPVPGPHHRGGGQRPDPAGQLAGLPHRLVAGPGRHAHLHLPGLPALELATAVGCFDGPVAPGPLTGTVWRRLRRPQCRTCLARAHLGPAQPRADGRPAGGQAQPLPVGQSAEPAPSGPGGRPRTAAAAAQPALSQCLRQRGRMLHDPVGLLPDHLRQAAAQLPGRALPVGR